MRTWVSCKSQTTSPTRIYWSATILSREIAAHEDDFLSFLMRKSGGHHTLVPSVAAVMPNLSMVLPKGTQCR